MNGVFMRFISLFLTLVSFSSFAAPEQSLPELMTKQSLNNIRYLSKNGKITYYQNNSGDLKYSSNYQVKLIKNSSAQTQYLLTASSDEKWIGIEQISAPHRPLPGVRMNRLSIGKFSDEKTTEIGLGNRIQFQLGNRFFTYFNPSERKIVIGEMSDPKQTRSVQIFDKGNLLFVPEAHLITENDLVFTDINSKGYSAVLNYSISDKKFQTVFKSSNPNSKLDICFKNDYLIIGEFPKYALNEPSQIFKVNLFNNPNYKQRETLYTSPNSDIGNMLCDDKEIFFVKTVGVTPELNSKESEVASVLIDTKKLTIHSKRGDITQLTKMGDYILAPYRGKYLIVRGNTEITDDSIKKGRP